MLSWISEKLFGAVAMVKSRKTAETKMVQAQDVQEALQSLDTAYAVVTDLITAQSSTISRLQRELEAVKEKKKTKKSVPEAKEDEKMEEAPAEPEAEKVDEEKQKEENKEMETPAGERPQEENKEWETPAGAKKEEKKEAKAKKREPELRSSQGDSPRFPPPPPSDTSECIDLEGGETAQPPWKRGRYENNEVWTCFRCLTRCGQLSKKCRVAISDLSNPALIGSWIRIAHKGRPDDRNEFGALTSEIKLRGLIEPGDRRAGEIMLKDLNTSLSLGTPIPKEYVRKPQVVIEEVLEPEEAPKAPTTPMEAPADPSPPTPMGSTGPGPVFRESEEEFASRVKAMLLALEDSGMAESLKAQIMANLVRM